MKNAPLIFIFVIILFFMGVFVVVNKLQTNINSPSPTPTSAYMGTPVLPNTTSINLYFIALEDSGSQGEIIGCNDSLVSLPVEISSEGNQIENALEKLFSVTEETYPDTDLYNALYQSSLTVESISVENAIADVRLSGEVVAGGVCDNPRIEAQLTQTVQQFQNVSEVNIYINNEPLASVLSLQ